MLSLKPFRKACVPLLAVQTADPASVVKLSVREASVAKVGGGKVKASELADAEYKEMDAVAINPTPVLRWDCIHGIKAANAAGEELARTLNRGPGGEELPAAIATGNPVEALRQLETLRDIQGAERAVVVLLGLADVLADPAAGIPARQALWNLRDALKTVPVLAVLVVPLGWRNLYPNDIAVAVDDLPTREELSTIVDNQCKSTKAPAPASDLLSKAADALIGLSGFAAEQATALSLSKSGLDLGGLWARKRQQIAETPGLSVYAGGERFADLGGLDQAKDLFSRVLKGRRKPGAIIFIDEIEKAMAGSAFDSSGVSQSILGYLLSYMQDQGATGSIFVGPPGAAKSALAKSVGAEGDIPTVALDLGGVKGSLVGESESRMRAAMAVITAISAGRPMFLATCNGISSLPPELRRRFTLGTMFFDLPTEQERAKIWPIYLKKFGFETNLKAFRETPPKSDGWTGAEIRQCVDLADRLGCSLAEAARFVVPVSVSAREKIDQLRTEASGRYLSASGAGIYQKPTCNGSAARKFEL